jgi:hypothetical protein
MWWVEEEIFWVHMRSEHSLREEGSHLTLSISIVQYVRT